MFAIDPNNPPTSTDEALGSFSEDDLDLTPFDILKTAENWIRSRETTIWVPGAIIPVETDDPETALGHILVRAAPKPAS